jgi:uncharacterized protein
MESKEQNYGLTGEPEAADREAGGEAGRDPAEPSVVEDPAGRERTGYEAIGDEGVGRGAVGMGTREERTWSVLAHLSTFLNIFTLFLGPVAALIVWLVYRDRSPRVGFEALQSAVYQGAWLAILGIGWAVTIALTFVLVGFLLIPAMLILTVVPFAHAGYAAYRVSKDGGYRYPIVADLIENR